MGFFDDNDDDTDEEPKRSSVSHNNVDDRRTAGNIDDDGADEDPLDAYMKELAHQDQVVEERQPEQLGDTTLRQKPVRSAVGTRMDLHEEEDGDEDDEDDEDQCVRTNSHPFGQERKQCGAESPDEDEPRRRLSHHHDDREELARPPHQSMMFVKGKTQGDDVYTDRQNSSLGMAQQTPANPSIVLLRKNLFTPQSTAMGDEWRRVHDATLVPIRQQRQYNNNSSNNSNNSNHHHFRSVDPILQFLDVQSILGPNLYERLLMDYPTPTPVQSQTLPVTLSGKDALVTAATGQGKTLMYLLSVLSHVRRYHSITDATLTGGRDTAAGMIAAPGPSALVLCPTRELALQVQSTVQPLAKACHVTSRAIIGGQNKFTLWQELKRIRLDLVIATPGRLLDVVSDKKGFGLRSVGFVVLDEADKMLQMGFDEQVRSILRQVPTNRQTLMLSATMGNKVGVLASDLLQRDAVRISVGRTGESSHHVQQHVMVLPDEDAKEAFMIEMVPVFLPLGRCIVFVATREKCEYIAKILRDRTALSTPTSSTFTSSSTSSTSSSPTDMVILTLHGDLHQSDRTAAIRAFRKGECQLLIATDVASRGLDVPNVQTIVSFDPAKTLDAHVHRVGRAGRLSNDALDGGQMTGSAYTLLTKANTDFAFVLRNSFQREERPISEELEALAQRSRKAGGGGTVDVRKGGNKQGLGFTAEAGDYYGSHEATDPPMKKSRWK